MRASRATRTREWEQSRRGGLKSEAVAASLARTREGTKKHALVGLRVAMLRVAGRMSLASRHNLNQMARMRLSAADRIARAQAL